MTWNSLWKDDRFRLTRLSHVLMELARRKTAHDGFVHSRAGRLGQDTIAKLRADRALRSAKTPVPESSRRFDASN